MLHFVLCLAGSVSRPDQREENARSQRSTGANVTVHGISPPLTMPPVHTQPHHPSLCCCCHTHSLISSHDRVPHWHGSVTRERLKWRFSISLAPYWERQREGQAARERRRGILPAVFLIAEWRESERVIVREEARDLNGLTGGKQSELKEQKMGLKWVNRRERGRGVHPGMTEN